MQLSDYKSHKPVLLTEIIENLKPADGECYVDATFGAGGYSRAILESAKCKLYAFDRDPSVQIFADKLKRDFKDDFQLIYSQFSKMEAELKALEVDKVDAIILDLGVSSMQLDNDERGFSFNSDHKLDMRMDSNLGLSAYEVVNEMAEVELAKIIKDFGEERKARQIAKRIVADRKVKSIETAIELAEIVRSFYGHRKQGGIDPATKTFQAIRIFVNQELEELKDVLEASKKLLKKGGRLIVVSFHSLEDSYVKSFLRDESGYNDRNFSRYQPEINNENKFYHFSLPKSSAIKPSKEELKINIRSRSARMRVAIKN